MGDMGVEVSPCVGMEEAFECNKVHCSIHCTSASLAGIVADHTDVSYSCHVAFPAQPADDGHSSCRRRYYFQTDSAVETVWSSRCQLSKAA